MTLTAPQGRLGGWGTAFKLSTIDLKLRASHELVHRHSSGIPVDISVLSLAVIDCGSGRV